MASGPAPNHDFAPAWLKIPTNSQRPSVGAVNNSSNSDSGRRGGSDASSFPARQKTSSGRDRGRSSTAASGGIGFPPRQHSIDSIEESATQKGAQNAHVFKLGAAGQRQYSSSQPSLDRRSLARHNYRDLGRPSPNTTSDISGSVSGGGRRSAGYDERHHSRDGQWPLGRQRSFERGREGRNKERIQRCKEEDIVQKFEQEFPSLIGGATEDRAPVAAPPNSSVWDSGKIGKIHLSTSVSKKLHLVQKPIRNEISVKQRSSSPVGGSGGGGGGGGHTTATVTGSPKPTTHAAMLMQPVKNGTGRNSVGVTNTATIGSMYRALLPSKGLMVRRSSKENSKTNGQSTSDKVLNEQLVTQPSSLLTNKKSEFLKELKLDDRRPPISNAAQDNVALLSEGTVNVDDKSNKEGGQSETNFQSNGVSDDQDFHPSDDYVSNEQPPVVNGIQIERSSSTDASEDNWVLSSSLEAEQRLLREMGWKEEGSEDEGVYAPLTEDEMKEMERLSKVFQKRNGMQRNLHVSWSPKRILPIPKNLDPANEDGGMTSSSTSSDSDSD